MYWDHRLNMDAREPQSFQSGTLILQGGPMVRILITGTSWGIGLATALELGRAGHKVYATMRNPRRAPELGERASGEDLPIFILTMDVDSDQSVAECFASLYGRGEHIDVLVNNAGIERHGSVEEMPLEDFRAAMET